MLLFGRFPTLHSKVFVDCFIIVNAPVISFILYNTVGGCLTRRPRGPFAVSLLVLSDFILCYYFLTRLGRAFSILSNVVYEILLTSLKCARRTSSFMISFDWFIFRFKLLHVLLEVESSAQRGSNVDGIW